MRNKVPGIRGLVWGCGCCGSLGSLGSLGSVFLGFPSLLYVLVASMWAGKVNSQFLSLLHGSGW